MMIRPASIACICNMKTDIVLTDKEEMNITLFKKDINRKENDHTRLK